MKPFLPSLLAIALAGVSTAGAGAIIGRVHAEGKAGADSDPNCAPGNYDSRAYKFAQRVDYAAMHLFVVYLEGPVAAPASALTNLSAQVVTKKVSQKKASFEPHVLPVLKGTTVEWPNNDDIYHNVFSYSDACPFDLGLYKKGDESKKVTFSTTGRVDVFCSIHSSMNCVVLVLENPYFATTNDKGDYSIPNVPAGIYKLKAWHERLPSQIQQVTVPESGEVKVNFTLGINGLPKL